MHQSLYREYRPLTFDEVLGQDSITKILKNQIINNKLSHAYLFSGSRGTGKTSSAKIFSRAVNCLHTVDGNPCNLCANCKAILEGTTMDVVEMDAASNRKIDDIRELREKVIYPPTGLRYKVYIIDEAHMITMEGFNALLKIMEEPPRHLIFILATTELGKIPATILSRTQRFEFKKIDEEDIEYNLNRVAKDIGLQLDEDAGRLIARKSDGAMRDALSMLDQAASLEKSHITLEDIHFVVGAVGEDAILSLIEEVVKARPDKILTTLDRIINQGKGVVNVVGEMVGVYRALLIAKSGGVPLTEESRAIDTKDFQNLCDAMELQQIYESLEILLDYESKMRMTDNERALCEVMLLRMMDHVDKASMLSRIRRLEKAVTSLSKGEGERFKALEARETMPEKEITEARSSLLESEGKEKPVLFQEEQETPMESQDGEVPLPEDSQKAFQERWHLALEELVGEGPLFIQFLKGAQDILKKEEKVYIVIDEKETFSMQRFNRPDYTKKIEEAVEKVMELSVTVRFVFPGELSEKPVGTQKVLEFFGKENVEIIR